jgi:hypothetical protein
MIDIEMSMWIQQKLKANVKNCKDQGGKLNMRCFLCGDSRKSKQKRRGFFYKSTCSYFCFNCNETLIGLNVVARLENRSYADVREEYYKDKYINKPSYKKSKQYVDNKKKSNGVDLSQYSLELPEDAITYLKHRQILDAPFLDPKMKFRWDEKTDRIVIPWLNNGSVAYYQKRAIYKNNIPYLFPKIGKTVFNIDMVDPRFPYIFILEGVFDALFVKNGVAIGGKNLTQDQRDILKKRFPKHELVYFFDNHRHPGEMKEPAPMYRHLLKLSKEDPSMKFALWPAKINSIKDVNQWITKGGKNIFSDEKWLGNSVINSLRLKFIISSEINSKILKKDN